MEMTSPSESINQEVTNLLDKVKSHTKELLISCMIGNALEWYDFVIYGYFVVVFGALFFPGADPFTQVLASWGIFWTGFIARPLGSLVFGHLGDKVSRKFALTLSIFLMAIPTTLMGCLPTYDQVGVLAPVLLIILRTFQGFAIGGEFTGSMVFLVEHAPEKHRGLWGSWASFSAVVGVIVGSCLVTSLNHYLTVEQIHHWGWRIPFLLSIFGSVVGIYMRARLADPSVYLKVKARRKTESIPLMDLFFKYKSRLGSIFLLDCLTAVGFFIVAIFLATYFRAYLNYEEKIALSIHTLNMLIFAIAILLGGFLSDQFGRKRILALSAWGFIFLSYPLFVILQTANTQILLFVQAIFVVMFGLFFGVIPTTLSEMLPTQVRFSGLSIGHNTCMALIGGGTPFLATHLIQKHQDLASPAYLLIGAALISLSALPFIQERSRMPLDDELSN